MITDQRQTGVPSSTPFSTQRSQLIKPNQVNNIGSNSFSTNNGGQITSGATSVPKSAAFNPLRPANASSQLGSVSNSGASNQIGTAQGQGQANQIATGGSPAQSGNQQMSSTSPAGAQAQITQNAAPVVTSPSGLDQARSAIRGMRNADIITLLDEISNGTLYGRGDE